MLDKVTAIELVTSIKNELPENRPIDDLSLQEVEEWALAYLQNYCSLEDKIEDVFSRETIAYAYALTQENKS
ncbi:MAG: hypothetical protein HC784_01545 [Hydrococcus sp. CSU_1_8]|nr:hypothetical protein [Hydrococcus sp. CSU_1_8]